MTKYHKQVEANVEEYEVLDEYPRLYGTRFMLAFGQHNPGMWGPKTTKLGLRPSLGAFCTVCGLSAQFLVLLPSFGAYGPRGGDKHTNKHTDKQTNIP